MRYLVLVILFLSCGSSSEVNYYGKSVSIVKEDEIDIIDLTEFDTYQFPKEMETPLGISSYEDILVIIDRSHRNNLHLINKRDMSSMGSVIPRGLGPKELPYVTYTSSSPRGLLVQEPKSSDIYVYPYDSLISDNGYIDVYQPKSDGRVNRPILDADLLFYNEQGVSPISYSDVNFKSPISYHEYFEQNGVKELPGFYKSKMGAAIFGKIGDKLIVAYRWAPFIDVFDTETKDIKAYVYPDAHDLIYLHNKAINGKVNYNFKIKNTVQGYADVGTSDDFIYFLYSGNIFDPQPNGGTEGSQILVFNKLGELEKILKLPFPIMRFTVDDEELIYCYNFNTDEEHFFVFDATL